MWCMEISPDIKYDIVSHYSRAVFWGYFSTFACVSLHLCLYSSSSIFLFALLQPRGSMRNRPPLPYTLKNFLKETILHGMMFYGLWNASGGEHVILPAPVWSSCSHISLGRWSLYLRGKSSSLASVSAFHNFCNSCGFQRLSEIPVTKWVPKLSCLESRKNVKTSYPKSSQQSRLYRMRGHCSRY